MHRTTPENVQNGSSPLLAKNAMTESKTPKFAGQVLRRHSDVHRLSCIQASGTKAKRSLSARSIFVFDDVETALLVGHPQQTSVILEHVVGQRRRYPIPREYQEKIYRCRSTNQPREWLPNSKVQLTR